VALQAGATRNRWCKKDSFRCCPEDRVTIGA